MSRKLASCPCLGFLSFNWDAQSANGQGDFPLRVPCSRSLRAFPFRPRGLVSARFLDERRVHWRNLKIPKTRS